MKLGKFKNGKVVRISKNSMNRHITIFGKPGSGKSVRIKEIENDAVQNGKTVIAFELLRGSADADPPNVNRIDAVADGIALPILDMSAVDAGLETKVAFITYLTELLAGTETLGCRQTGALREAIIHAIEHRSDYPTDLKAIADGLKMQRSASAKGVYNKLWSLLCSDAFRESQKKIKAGYINIFSLERMHASTQTSMVELILGSIWRQIKLNGRSETEVVIVIDEIQKIRTKKNSVIAEMLRESRQYNVSLILATQSAGAVNKEILKASNEAAISLYFQPSSSEIKKIAELIDPQQTERYTLQLQNLKKGHSIVTGKVEIDGQENDRPIVIKSEYEENNKVLIRPKQICIEKQNL